MKLPFHSILNWLGIQNNIFAISIDSLKNCLLWYKCIKLFEEIF